MISGISSANSFGGTWQVQQSGTRSSAEDLFSKIDADGDGSVSKSELNDFQKEMQARFEQAVVSSQFATSDSSSTEEVFARIDANGDGSVTESEFSDFQTEMKENMQAMGPPPPPPQSTDSFSASGTDDNIASMLKQAVNQYTQNAQDSESTDIYGSAVNAYE